MSNNSDVKPGDFIYYGSGAMAIVEEVFEPPLTDGTEMRAIINPENPAAYNFGRVDGKWQVIDDGTGGSYRRPGRAHWDYATQLRARAGIKNPHSY